MARAHKLPICFDGGQWMGSSPLDSGPGAGTVLPLNDGAASGTKMASPDGDSLGGLQIAYVGFDYPLLDYGNDMSQRYRSIAWKGSPSTVNMQSTTNAYSCNFIGLRAASDGTFLRTSIPVAVGDTGGYTHTATTFTYGAGGFGTDGRFIGSICRVDGTTYNLTVTSHTNTVLTGTWDTEPVNDTDVWKLDNTNSFDLQILDGVTAITAISSPLFKSDMAASDIWELQVDTGTGGNNAARLIRNGTEIFGWTANAAVTSPLSLKTLGGTILGKSPSSGIIWDFDWIDVYDSNVVSDLSALSNFAVTARYAFADKAVGDYIGFGNIAACGVSLWPGIDDAADGDNQSDDYISAASTAGTGSNTSSTSFTDSGAVWTPGEWVDFYVITAGAWMKITSNTGITLTGVAWTPSGAPVSDRPYAILKVNTLTACDFEVADAQVAAETPTIEGLAVEAIAIDAGSIEGRLTVIDPATDFACRIVTSSGTDILPFYLDTFHANGVGGSYYCPTAGAPASEASAWTKTIFDHADTTFGVQGKLLEATKVWGLIVHICGENLVKQTNAVACPAPSGRRRLAVVI